MSFFLQGYGDNKPKSSTTAQEVKTLDGIYIEQVPEQPTALLCFLLIHCSCQPSADNRNKLKVIHSYNKHSFPLLKVFQLTFLHFEGVLLRKRETCRTPLSTGTNTTCFFFSLPSKVPRGLWVLNEEGLHSNEVSLKSPQKWLHPLWIQRSKLVF